jgi:glycosyltransferase involved in cell wall biosynthesis
MSRRPSSRNVLMIAYTNYKSDPRCLRAAEAAVGAGFHVDFIALRRDGEPPVEDVHGVRLIHLAQSRYRGKALAAYVLNYLMFFFRCFFKTAALHWKNRYAVVHVNNMPDFFIFCACVPKLMGAKLILDIHDPMPNTFASKYGRNEASWIYKLLLCQERLSARYADRVITVHDPVKDLVLAGHGLHCADVTVVANFPDDELFQPQKNYEINGQLKLVFHGTILERSGLRTVVQAIAALPNRERLSLKIIGEGDFSEDLKKLIQYHNLTDTVDFQNSSFPAGEIPARISDCNLGLSPLTISSSTNYALPLKLVEYICLGMPVITVRAAAIMHYFREEDCLFYQHDEPKSLTQLLQRLLGNPDILLRYRERSLALRERFSWKKEREKYINMLEELSQQHSPARKVA